MSGMIFDVEYILIKGESFCFALITDNYKSEDIHCPAKVWTHLEKSFFFCIYRFNYRSLTVLYSVFVQNNIVLITFERFLLIIIYLL